MERDAGGGGAGFRLDVGGAGGREGFFGAAAGGGAVAFSIPPD